jgi:ubiquitin carboxyl-terminal hydrolase L5
MDMVDDSASLDTVQKEVADIIKEGKETIEASLNELSSSIAQHEMRIAAETERQAKWKAENERRRHNYVPLIFELLQ